MKAMLYIFNSNWYNITIIENKNDMYYLMNSKWILKYLKFYNEWKKNDE